MNNELTIIDEPKHLSETVEITFLEIVNRENSASPQVACCIFNIN